MGILKGEMSWRPWGSRVIFLVGNISLILVAYPPCQQTSECHDATPEAAAACGSDTHLHPNVLWQPVWFWSPNVDLLNPTELGAIPGDQEWL